MSAVIDYLNLFWSRCAADDKLSKASIIYIIMQYMIVEFIMQYMMVDCLGKSFSIILSSIYFFFPVARTFFHEQSWFSDCWTVVSVSDPK